MFWARPSWSNCFARIDATVRSRNVEREFAHVRRSLQLSLPRQRARAHRIEASSEREPTPQCRSRKSPRGYPPARGATPALLHRERGCERRRISRRSDTVHLRRAEGSPPESPGTRSRAPAELHDTKPKTGRAVVVSSSEAVCCSGPGSDRSTASNIAATTTAPNEAIASQVSGLLIKPHMSFNRSVATSVP
jgi:hypothetical protein